MPPKSVVQLCEIGQFGLRPALAEGAYDIGQGVPQFLALLQFEKANAHNFIKITIIFQHSNSYMFRALPVHNQGAHSCTTQLFDIFCIYQNAEKFAYPNCTVWRYSSTCIHNLNIRVRWIGGFCIRPLTLISWPSRLIRRPLNDYDFDYANHDEDKMPAPSDNSVTTVQRIGHSWLTRNI